MPISYGEESTFTRLLIRTNSTSNNRRSSVGYKHLAGVHGFEHVSMVPIVGVVQYSHLLDPTQVLAVSCRESCSIVTFSSS